MKIALLHKTTPWGWPIHNLAADQAELLVRQEHEVVVITGSGEKPATAEWEVASVPELLPSHALAAPVLEKLRQGQVDQGYALYREALTQALLPRLQEFDVVLVHDHLTSKKNLALNHVLHEAAPSLPLIGWTHDVDAVGLPAALAKKMPWALLTKAAAHTPYVAPNELVELRLRETLGPTADISRIPPFANPGRILNLSLEIQESLPELGYAQRDFVFLAPLALMPKNNLELALALIQRLLEKQRNPLLLISAPPLPEGHPHAAYAQHLRQQVNGALAQHVVFVSDFIPTTAAIMSDLYQIADCALLTATQPVIGMQVFEAAWHRLPVWTLNTPALTTLAQANAFPIDSPASLDRAVPWLEAQPAYQARRAVRRIFDAAALYQEHYLPLLEKAAQKRAGRA